MDISKLSAADKRILYAGAAVAISSLISFLDPSGSWGPIMGISLLAGLGIAYVVVQPQMQPAMKLPASKAILLLGLGVAALAGYLLSALNYLKYFIGHLIDPFELVFIAGGLAAAYVAWTGWVAYKAQQGKAAPPAPPAAPPPPPPAS